MAGEIRILQWAVFGAVVGLIISLLLTVGALIFSAIIGLPLEIVLIGAAILIIISVIVNAITWAVLGIIYDLFLVNVIGSFPLFSQLVALLIIVGIVSSLVSFQPASLIPNVISSFISAVIIFTVTRVTGIPTPFESG